MAKPLEIVEQLLNPRCMAHRRITIGRASWAFGRIDAMLPVDMIKMLGLCVVGLEVLVAQRPGRRNAAVVSNLTEILLTKPQQGRAINLRIAADVILNAGKERLAVLVIPGLFGPVLGFDKDRLGIPVVFLARQVAAAFEKQNPFPRRRQMVSQRSSAGSRSDDDDVVTIVFSHVLLSEHRR